MGSKLKEFGDNQVPFCDAQTPPFTKTMLPRWIIEEA